MENQLREHLDQFFWNNDKKARGRCLSTQRVTGIEKYEK